MSHELQKVTWRKQAKQRRAPYRKLYTQGRYIGWRKMSAKGPGKWLAYAWNGSGYDQQPLGDFAQLPEEERYRAALAAAVKHWEHLDMGGSARPESVRAACEAYVARQRAEKGDRAAGDAEGFLRRLVYGQPIARVELSRLTKAG